MKTPRNHCDRRGIFSQVLCPLLAIWAFVLMISILPRADPPLVEESSAAGLWHLLKAWVTFVVPVGVYLVARYFSQTPKTEGDEDSRKIDVNR